MNNKDLDKKLQKAILNIKVEGYNKIAKIADPLNTIRGDGDDCYWEIDEESSNDRKVNAIQIINNDVEYQIENIKLKYKRKLKSISNNNKELLK